MNLATRNRRAISISVSLLFLFLLAPSVRAAPLSPPDAKFIVAMTQDAAGRVWIGTEDRGVLRYDATAEKDQQWTTFTTKDGLGDDNAYAMCVDKLGRVWVGHLGHGVSVFNGQTWKNYDVIDGPLGERIYSLATDPTTGDVWMATCAGLTRYSPDKDNWTHYTRADGLPSEQFQSLAFDAKGTLYAGSQYRGLAISDAADNHKTWRTVAGSDKLPLFPAGKGLPTNLINQVLAARGGSIYVATTCGLAWIKDQGQTWSYLRGDDWVDKARGLDGGVPSDWKEEAVAFVLLEDYCECLAEDASGLLWIGHRQKGYEVIDPAKLERRYSSQADEKNKIKQVVGDRNKTPPIDCVYSILAAEGRTPLVGWYGQGVTAGATELASTAGETKALSKPPVPPLVAVNAPRHPASAAPPTLEELNGLLARLGEVPVAKRAKTVVAELTDDWRTQGDWRGRYGRYWANLCAGQSPHDIIWGAGDANVSYDVTAGAHAFKGDSNRYWVHWLYTEDRRVLELPSIFMDNRVTQGKSTADKNRRQAEWNDNSQGYPFPHDGPHLYANIEIPKGRFYLSLYEFNKDGHEGLNHLRDYKISIRTQSPNAEARADDGFEQRPEAARGRIHDFWGGVWKRFYVVGPTKLTIQLQRNHSFCTILCGLMLDRVEEQPLPYFHTLDEKKAETDARSSARKALLGESPEVRAARFVAGKDRAVVADLLFDELLNTQLRNQVWWATESRRYYAALLLYYRASERAAAMPPGGAEKPVNKHLTTCFYELRLFPEWEERQRAENLLPARDLEKALRWNKETDPDQRDGFKIVSEYRESLKKP